MSDHCAIVVKRVEIKEQLIKPFKFFNFWNTHTKIINVVICSWQEMESGNPIKIFVLMNVLSSLLNLVVKYDVFKYHSRCKCIGLTHLSFADDLLVF